MPNAIFDVVVDELDTFIVDILALGMTKKALQKVGATPETVSKAQMSKALNVHIKPNLNSFMSPDKSMKLVRHIEKKFMAVS